MSLSWQSAADDYLRQRSADSRRTGKMEPYRTVTSRPEWPSWSPPNAEPEASAAPVAPALCGHSIEPLTPNVQPHSEQTAASSSDHRWCRRTSSFSSPGDMKWTPGPVSWQRQMTSIWGAVGAAVTGSSHCNTWRPPVQTASVDCRRWHWGYGPTPRRWYVPMPPEPPKRWLSPAVVENPTTSPGSWWGSVEVGWPSTMPRCRRNMQ